ncbi:SGNH hydrolase-type esterase domain-containing protein [Globomyces pollinis-pini]|nr:SGNH hydrolase-type esterase domain-containing protein [Globomyces pollinis-pini]
MKDVLVIGSSLVACTLGGNWMDWMKSEKYRFHNYGINGVQIPGIIDQIQNNSIPVSLKPAMIILMAGGNDLSASLKESEKIQGYEKMMAGRLGRPKSSPEQFHLELTELINLIKERYDVPLIISNIKPIGEDINGKLNDVVRTFNKVIETVIAENKNLTLLDVHTPLAALANQAKDVIKNPIGSDDISAILDPQRMITVFLYNKFSFGWYSLNDLGESRGFYSTCDGSHFNERSTAIVAQCASETLDALNK